MDMDQPPPPMPGIPSSSWAANEVGLFSPCYRSRRRGPDGVNNLSWSPDSSVAKLGPQSRPTYLKVPWSVWKKNFAGGVGGKEKPFHVESKRRWDQKETETSRVCLWAGGLCMSVHCPIQEGLTPTAVFQFWSEQLSSVYLPLCWNSRAINVCGRKLGQYTEKIKSIQNPIPRVHHHEHFSAFFFQSFLPHWYYLPIYMQFGFLMPIIFPG